jgi:hypothetical protein
MECTPESGLCHSVYSVFPTTHTHTFMKGKDAENGRPGKVVFLYLRIRTAVNHCNSIISLSIYTVVYNHTAKTLFQKL